MLEGAAVVAGGTGAASTARESRGMAALKIATATSETRHATDQPTQTPVRSDDSFRQGDAAKNGRTFRTVPTPVKSLEQRVLPCI
jgi:hypothetical protein